jgi:hypothetical protein
MCYYITATLPPGADVERVRGIAKQFHLAWKPIEAPHVISQLRSGETYYLTTTGECDCETVLGYLSTPKAERRNTKTAQNRKAEAANWMDFLGAVLSTGASTSLGLLLHWYTGPLDTPDIKLAERKRVPMSTLTPDDLLRMEKDRLYEFINA